MRMPEIPTLFDRHATFDPAGDFEAFLKEVPARWAVYLLADADDRPVQLLCVKNLRYSVKRRLGIDQEAAGPSRRVDYRDIVRRIHWRRVDSAFEADWLYYEAARQIFPQTYAGMVGFRPAWFVHVNPDSPFPRYVKATDLSKPGLLIGPLEDKHSAASLIELAEDSFDLCRYYNILVEAPAGKACAYKEMGKCPAPCDGSISMEHYREMIAWSAASVVDPLPVVRDQTRRMQQAAAELRFESAGKIKGLIDKIGQLGKGPFRHVALLKDFRYLSLQHGPREGTANVFLITPGAIEQIASLIAESTRPADLLRLALERAAGRQAESLNPSESERVGIVTHHLFSGKHRGVFLRLDTIDEKSVVKGFRELRKQAPQDAIEGEGVMKELQSLEPAGGTG
jgi:excinuclease UvrABC nuclease subunit